MIRIDLPIARETWARKASALLIITFACGLSQSPAAAHDLPVTLDNGTEHACNIATALAMTAIVGLAVYFITNGLCLFYERKKNIEIPPSRVNLTSILFSIAAMIPLWGLTMPIPQKAAASGHFDTPQHGGQIRAVSDNHVELTVTADGTLALYLMGITERVSAPIAGKTLRAEVSSGSGEKDGVLLHAAPQRADPKGRSSVFEGRLPEGIAAKPATLTLSLPLDGRDQTVSFAIGGPGGRPAASDPVRDSTPVQVVATPITPEERRLYLTPGGLYTQADILANGATTPERKYAGMMANHHLSPKKGTYTCPITKTQANKKFSWIVHGKKYLFCCPPCIAEFVKQAKADPRSIEEPQDYIQK